MHPEDIKSELRKANWNQDELARALNVTQQSVSQVILGRCRSKKIEGAISKILGIPADEIWTQRRKVGQRRSTRELMHALRAAERRAAA